MRRNDVAGNSVSTDTLLMRPIGRPMEVVMLIRAKDGKRNWSRRTVFAGAILASAALSALATPRPAEAQGVYDYGYPAPAYSYSQYGHPGYWASPSYGYPSYGGGGGGEHSGRRGGRGA